jgi:hypothetical protein
MTNLIATLALEFIEAEPRLTYEAAIQAAMVSLGVSQNGVSIHSIID